MSSEDQSREDRLRGHSFDELARGLASGTISRRRALRLVGGALVGGLLTSILGGVAWAEPPEGRGRPCPKGQPKCGDTCCSPEDRCCRGVCTHVVFSRTNCGRCGNECAPGEDCCGGRCVPLNTEQNCGCCAQFGCACPAGVPCVFDEAAQAYRCAA